MDATTVPIDPAAAACGTRSVADVDERTHVVAELEPTAGRVRLHVTEDASAYGVTAACGDVDAEAFDVQLQDNRVWIGRRDRSMPPPVGGTSHLVERRTTERLFSLAFERPIDAAESRGESANGWLYLWLKKSDESIDSGRCFPA